MFRQGSDGAGDTGVEGLDPSHVGFRDTVSPKGMPDEVVGHSVKSLLQVKDHHKYWLFLLTVPLQEQPGGMVASVVPHPWTKPHWIGETETIF